ncbi:MAG: type I-MYXAN CRISPR-associated Cas8a1/Cmx1 [Geitlerinemataceae cyanobacterium]
MPLTIPFPLSFSLDAALAQTYRIKDGYLDPPALRLEKQRRYTFTQGITSTLLQHSKQRTLAKESQTLQFAIDEGQPELSLNFRPLLDCYYTRDFKDAFTSKGKLKPAISVKGHHLPGLVECFANGAYQESPENFIALLFLPLACGYYRLPSLRSALVIPEVSSLNAWVRRRKKRAGETYQQFCAGGAGEAGLRFFVWDKSSDELRKSAIDYCEVYQLGKQMWDGNQSYLKQQVYRIRAKPEMLALYQDALGFFPSKVRLNDKGESWLAISKVLPWVAENLIAERPWHAGFFEFRKANTIYPEDRSGLVKMHEHINERDRVLFDAVQGAFRTLLYEEGKQASKQGRSLDYKQVSNKAIYRLQRPSTQQQFASALVDFLSRYRSSAARGNGLEIAARLHSDRQWQQSRDLAMLAIATYVGKSKEESNAIEASEAESDSPYTEFS